MWLVYYDQFDLLIGRIDRAVISIWNKGYKSKTIECDSSHT